MASHKTKKTTVLQHMFCAGLSGSITECIALPVDTIKTRLMIDVTKSDSFVNTFKRAVGALWKEGPRSFFKGLTPGLHRQVLFASTRIGLYDPLMRYLYGEREHSTKLWEKVPVTMCTAFIGILVANPTEVVKIRLQEQTRNQYYSGCFDCYRKILKVEGLKGFWSGVVPNLSRNMIDSPTEIAIYYHSKELILHNGWMRDRTPLHCICGLIAGFTTSVIGNPLEISRREAKGGLISFGKNIIRNEGLFALYKGFLPYFVKEALFNILIFCIYERTKRCLALV